LHRTLSLILSSNHSQKCSFGETKKLCVTVCNKFGDEFKKSVQDSMPIEAKSKAVLKFLSTPRMGLELFGTMETLSVTVCPSHPLLLATFFPFLFSLLLIITPPKKKKATLCRGCLHKVHPNHLGQDDPTLFPSSSRHFCQLHRFVTHPIFFLFLFSIFLFVRKIVSSV